MITVIILTRNEEKDLPACLESLCWCDDVHVLDSGSTDETLSIAREWGARVSWNPFESFGQQRNFALDHLSAKYEWILFLDADERVTPAFLNAATDALRNAAPEIAGYYCCWKMMLDGVWLKHCDNFPKWQFRLLRKGRAKFTDFGHGQKEHAVRGRLAYLREPYLHFGFSKGWSAWVERHNRYSTQEAQARWAGRPPLRHIFSGHGSVRNPALRSWLSRVPGWPLLRFLHAYVVSLGFLEGRQGLIYCINMAYYEFLIKIKIREIRRRPAADKAPRAGIPVLT